MTSFQSFKASCNIALSSTRYCNKRDITTLKVKLVFPISQQCYLGFYITLDFLKFYSMLFHSTMESFCPAPNTVPGTRGIIRNTVDPAPKELHRPSAPGNLAPCRQSQQCCTSRMHVSLSNSGLINSSVPWMHLLLLPSKSEVYFPSSWIWARLVTCSDQHNAANVTLCLFWVWPVSGLTLLLLLFRNLPLGTQLPHCKEVQILLLAWEAAWRWTKASQLSYQQRAATPVTPDDTTWNGRATQSMQRILRNYKLLF